MVTATVLTCHVHARAAQLVSPWWPFNHSLLGFTCFILVLWVSAVIGAGLTVRLFTKLLQEHPIRRALPAVGLMLGGARGLWWAGMLLLIVLATERPYLTTSITQRSLVSPRLVKATQHNLRWLANRVPGHDDHAVLIPRLSEQSAHYHQ